MAVVTAECKERGSVSEKNTMSASEVAKDWGVDPKTVTRWARSGKIPKSAYFVTLGGHRRFYVDQMVKLKERTR